jgi:branched-subunit amino acid aminotransferase/4-amino-4-deoxychorismate lyase
MQVVEGRVFAEQAHLQRLEHSAQLLGLPLPVDRPTLHRWIAAVLDANQAHSANLRLFVVGGEGTTPATVFIWPERPPAYPGHFYTTGATAITFEGRRFLPQAKSLNNLVSYMARRQAQALGAHEALLLDVGYLSEGSNSNLFAVLDGEVATPPAVEVLSGVTRDLLVTLAAAHGRPIREAPLAVGDVARWSECFITSSSRHVMPITSIDGRPVGDGKPGPHTRWLSAIFEAHFEHELGLTTS